MYRTLKCKEEIVRNEVQIDCAHIVDWMRDYLRFEGERE